MKTQNNIIKIVSNKAIRCDNLGNILDVYSTSKSKNKDFVSKIKGSQIFDIFPKKLSESLKKRFSTLLKTGRTQKFEYQIDPASKFEFLDVRLLTNGSNECFVIFYDISEEKRAKAEIRRYVEELRYNKIISEQKSKELALVNNRLNQSEKELKKINANKDKFFSIISHDLRSPFTSLIGFSEFLANEVDELSKEEIKEFAQNIFKSARGTFSLLENLLQWSRLQTGNIEFAPSHYNLENHLNKLIEIYRINALRKKIKIVSKIEPKLKVFADQNMVETLMRNLISNAIKFTPREGTITISAKSMSKKIEIKVADTGVGMDKETQKKLFKVGENVSTEGTEKEQGTGLGLILCKEFVETNNGNIKVRSKPNEGTEFIITLPKNGNGKIFGNVNKIPGMVKNTNIYRFSK